MRALLAPLGVLWGGAAALRVALYRRGVLPRARLAGPVISVGNLSLGGSGKTPVVAWIAAQLRDAGLPVAILSRGYRGSFRGSDLVVGDGASLVADAATAGDEPVMLARALPGVVVAVGPKRDEVGRAVEARFGPRVHVLDDGFQHLRLARDLDVLCLGARDLDDRPVPAGRLREFASAVARADVVLLMEADGLAPAHAVALESRLGPERTFRVTRRAAGYRALDGAPRATPGRAYLLAGIARPERFEDDVRASGAVVVGRRFFRDHHAFTVAEIAAVDAEAGAAGADAIVSTEKDAVRLPLGGTDRPVAIFRITADVAGAGRLRERLLAVAGRVA